MFKFDKQVGQELEEGQISDGGVEEPQRRKPIVPVVAKLANREDDQSESREYVIEKFRMKTSSPPPERKKDRKEQKAEDKFQYERRRKPDISPDQHNLFNRPQPSLPPVNPYYVFPPQAMYPFARNDPRAASYMHMQPQPHLNMPQPNMNYPYPMPHWQPTHNPKPQDFQKMSQPSPMPQNYSQPMGYPPNNIYSHGSLPHHMQTEHRPIQQLGKKTYENPYQQQQPTKNPYQQPQPTKNPYEQQQSTMEQKKKQVQQEQKKRVKKIQELGQQIKQKINSQCTNEHRQQMVEILLILKSIINSNYIGDPTLKVLYQKMEGDPELKEKFLFVLSSLQMKEVARKLTEKELEVKLIGEEKKMKASELYHNLASKDPRLKAK